LREPVAASFQFTIWTSRKVGQSSPSCSAFEEPVSLVQQADAALVLSKIDPHIIEPDCKQVAIVHAKARTSVEIETFIAQFQAHDGISVSMAYFSEYKESMGKSYAASGKDPKYLEAIIMEILRVSSSVEPTGPGDREEILTTNIMANWPPDGGRPPSKATMRKA
jgi:hypothetical protein